jgi:hypothetical protein
MYVKFDTRTKGKEQIGGVREQGAEENVWT